MRNKPIVNIYNFIRMSHVEPSVFIPDDFETVRNQITLVRQYGLPATYALKYDALLDSRYQELIRTYTAETDEISAWWEISEPLCRKAGVPFRGVQSEEFDERVNSAYSIGYAPEERRRLVDAYMADFREIYGFYPRTIGSWVLDTVTISYAAEKYGILGSAICRDQMGTDGFTLWGGFPNGIYYPSRKNENIPANTAEGQLNVPMFRLLGPDPIYNFEQDVRPGLFGVYTLEPSWLIGRDPRWISYFFNCLTEEDTLGTGYAHVGQENNFLWENIKPGMEPQLKKLESLLAEGKIRVETMADSAAWFSGNHKLTPPMTFQASGDWDASRNLSAQWYACSNYRAGFLGEEGHLRIRDFFLYRQDYPSRYLDAPMHCAKSNFDALPVLFPQIWIDQFGQRPFIRLLDEKGAEPTGLIRYRTLDEITAQASLEEPETGQPSACFTLYPDRMVLAGNYRLRFDYLPVLQALDGKRVLLKHEGFSYGFEVETGTLSSHGTDGLEICPENGSICLKLGTFVDANVIFSGQRSEESGKPISHDGNSVLQVPPRAPVLEPASCIFPAGSTARIQLTSQARDSGTIHYTMLSWAEAHCAPAHTESETDTEPTSQSALYSEPLELCRDTIVSARLFLPDGRCSERVTGEYLFGIPGITLSSNTKFDPRPVFCGNGVRDFLEPTRGSLDYLDGRWRGTLEDLDVSGQLPGLTAVEKITIGFLSHHRSGIIFPESLQLYTGKDADHLTLTAELAIPCKPCAREIARQDFSLPVHEVIGAFRLIAHRYEKMPQWCCYKGTTAVFTMADNIIVTPEPSGEA